MRRYYAFTYLGDKNERVGEPNKSTGRRNIAGNLSVFSLKSQRDIFVAEYPASREAVKARYLRYFFHGISARKLKNHLKSITVNTADLFCIDDIDNFLPNHKDCLLKIINGRSGIKDVRDELIKCKKERKC